MTPRKTALLLAAFVLSVVGSMALIPADFTLGEHSLSKFDFRLQPGGLVGTAKSIWAHDNWHLLGYLLICLPPLWLILPKAARRAHGGVATALAAAVGLFLFLFGFTSFAARAINSTVGRLLVQLMPSRLFFVALLCKESPFLRRGGALESERAAELRP